jgi:hypothetical protein
MTEQLPRGSVARIYMDIVASGVGVVSQNPNVAIQRKADGMWFQASDGAWMPTIVNHTMAPLDVANLPGRYFFDFDQSKDELEASIEYIVKLVNTGANPRLEYRDLRFGPILSVVAPKLCAIRGTVFDPQGRPEANVLIRATIEPVYTDGLGRTARADHVVITHSNELGDFELQLVQGVTARLEIDDVGYDRRITVPAQAFVYFTDLD